MALRRPRRSSPAIRAASSQYRCAAANQARRLVRRWIRRLRLRRIIRPCSFAFSGRNIKMVAVTASAVGYHSVGINPMGITRPFTRPQHADRTPQPHRIPNSHKTACRHRPKPQPHPASIRKTPVPEAACRRTPTSASYAGNVYRCHGVAIRQSHVKRILVGTQRHRDRMRTRRSRPQGRQQRQSLHNLPVLAHPSPRPPIHSTAQPTRASIAARNHSNRIGCRNRRPCRKVEALLQLPARHIEQQNIVGVFVRNQQLFGAVRAFHYGDSRRRGNRLVLRQIHCRHDAAFSRRQLAQRNRNRCAPASACLGSIRQA